MPIALRHLILSAAVLVLFALQASAADKWIRLRTEHFDTIGNTPDATVRRVAQTLEHFHQVVVSAVLRGAGSSRTRTVVVVFDDDMSFAPYKPQGAGRSSIGALFLVGDDDTILALNADNLQYALQTVLNGYSRSILFRTTGRVPLWLSTGLGSVYETFEERAGGKGAMIGRPGEDLGVLKGATLLPLSTLITLKEGAANMTLGTRPRMLFDAESWALVHYLTFGARQDQLHQYLAALRAGTDAEQAFRSTMGDIAVLEKELNDYIRNFLFPAIQVNFEEKVKPVLPPKSDVLSAGDSESYLSSLLARSGYVDQARTRLAKVLAANPDQVAAVTALARIEFSQNQPAKGLPLLERAATLSPDDPGVHVMLGHRLAYEIARKGADRSADELTHARSVLTRAVELAPDDFEASADLGWMMLLPPDDPGKATAILSRVVEQAPANEQYKIWLSDALLRTEEFDRASKYLGPLMARGSTPEIRSEARRLLSTISDRQRRSAAARGGDRSDSAAPASSTRGPAGLPTPSSLSSPSTSNNASYPAGSDFIPVLRKQEAGEMRVVGTFRAIECGNGTIGLLVDSGGQQLRLTAETFADIEFLSYRNGTPSTVACGTMPAPLRVLATYRPTAAADNSAGEAVAIELLPDGFEPPK